MSRHAKPGYCGSNIVLAEYPDPGVSPARLLTALALGISSSQTQGAPAHSQRTGGEDGGRVGANESSSTPRLMPREPATPTSYGPARRGAALLCWGFPGAAR